MKSSGIVLNEWKHFVRSPFKVVALILFLLTGIYGLHNGASLYQNHTEEIAKIQEKVAETRQEGASFYDEGVTGPEDRPWVDVTTPFWSIWYASIYHFKSPSPALVYSIGQAEQYGFYKRVSTWGSPYDSDMTQEIANPERLQTGTLDFSFALLFLLPLLLLILLYNLRSSEAEQGFLPLIEVQATSTTPWLLNRMAFYVGLLWLVTVGLLAYGALLTPVFSRIPSAFGQMLLYSTLYLLFWSVLYFLLIRTGSSVMGNALKMVGVWLLFAFIMPGMVHQWISIKKPADLITNLIEAQRDQAWKLYDLPDSVRQAKINALFPEIANSPIAGDSGKRQEAYNTSTRALVNELVKNSIVPIEAGSKSKNKLVKASFLFNPIAFFQNRLNSIAGTHYDDYQRYRSEIQSLIDKQITTLILDTWEDVPVDKQQFQEYQHTLAQP